MTTPWESLEDPKDEAGLWRMVRSDRLKVPGGWIVRSRNFTMNSHGGTAIHQLFIPDINHEWKLEE